MRAGQQVPNPCRMHLSLLMFRALRFRVWQRSGASVTCQHEDNNAHRRVSVLCKILKSSILRTDTKTHTYTTTRTNSKHTNTHELHTDYSKTMHPWTTTKLNPILPHTQLKLPGKTLPLTGTYLKQCQQFLAIVQHTLALARKHEQYLFGVIASARRSLATMSRCRRHHGNP